MRGCVVAVLPMCSGVLLLYCQCARVCCCCINNVRGYVAALLPMWAGLLLLCNVRGCVVAVLPMCAGMLLLYYQCEQVCCCCVMCALVYEVLTGRCCEMYIVYCIFTKNQKVWLVG